MSKEIAKEWEKEMAMELFQLVKPYTHGFGYGDFLEEEAAGNVSLDLTFFVKSLGWEEAVERYVATMAN